MKTMIFSDNKDAAKAVYAKAQVARLQANSELCDGVYTKSELMHDPSISADTEYLFSTWGMPRFSGEEIKKCFPNLKAVLYAAGSVQGFAKEFLENGIFVSSAWVANGIPVAEYTFAHIMLALKGFFSTQNYPKHNVFPAGFDYDLKGSYKAKVGVCGVGAIGSMVCERLKSTECEVYAFDKFLPKERADELGITLVSLEEIFESCDVITNHLANKQELNGIYNLSLFSRMKPCSTFINTGRGAQVNEADLAQAMKKNPSLTALLDVTWPEPVRKDSPLCECPNVIITPHIAGSIGNERNRLADWMIDEFLRITSGGELKYSVTLDMLKIMA